MYRNICIFILYIRTSRGKYGKMPYLLNPIIVRYVEFYLQICMHV